MLVIAFHEFGHAITACCTGGKVESISLDPREGGVTHMRGGISAVTLPAGYLGSSLIGALLIFCGFDIVASKVASIVLGVCFLLTLWWARRDWLTIVTVLLAVGLLVACWFIAHAEALKYVVLFIGVMSALYSVWDIVRSARYYSKLLLLIMNLVRRLDPSKSQYLRRLRLRREIRRLFSVLGCYLVYHLPPVHGWRNSRWDSCIPGICHPAEG
jgi:hypothetical protein